MKQTILYIILVACLVIGNASSGLAKGKKKQEDPEITKLKGKIESVMSHVDAQPDWLYSRLQMYWKTHATDVFVNGERFDHPGGERAPEPTVKYAGLRGTESQYNRPKLEDIVPYDDDEQGSVTYINKASGKMEKAHPAKTGCNIQGVNRQIMGVAYRNVPIDLFCKRPILVDAVKTSAEYLFPNRMIAGFGDTHPNYLNTGGIDNLLKYATRHKNKGLMAEMNALKSAVDAKASAAEIELYTSKFFYAPNVSWIAMRTGMDKQHDLMASLNGSLGNHAHANGISLELYGKGYVNQRALYQELDQILPLYEKWGISGIKFGFVQIGSQEWTTWIHNAVKKCADHHIMVDIHDEYRPTGWSRTYPNLMTQEGIGGNEEMPDAEHNTILPFTRFLCGPADYTPCYFNGRVKNTKAHQLAMPVVYYSPITFLYWYDLPNAYKGENELDFWKHCPTVWDDSKALQGEIGEYIVEARRSGGDWFVGAMNGLQARDITINTADFLQKGKKYRVEIYNDDPTLTTRTKVVSTEMTVKAGKAIKLHLQASGGAAMRFVPVK